MEQQLLSAILKGIDTEKAEIKKQKRIKALQKLERDGYFIKLGLEILNLDQLPARPVEVICVNILIRFLLSDNISKFLNTFRHVEKN